MKNKYKHGKAIAATTMALAAVSLVTVGFSAWVISVQTKQSTSDISVSVGAIKDQTVPLTLLGTQGLTENSAVKFDGVQDTDGEITCDSNSEDMTFAITFSADTTNGFEGVTVAATEATTGTYLTTWAAATYIKLPFKLENTDADASAETFIPLIDKAWTVAGTHYITYDAGFVNNTIKDVDDPKGGYDVKVDITAKDKIISYVCTFNFHWGAKFNGENPVKEANTSLTTEKAKEALAEMQKTSKFNLTVKHDPKVAVNVDNQ